MVSRNLLSPLEAAELIERRSTAKQDLLREMRRERILQHAHKNSHVGYEMSAGLEAAALAPYYHAVAQLRDRAEHAGHPTMRHTFNALLMGMARYAIELGVDPNEFDGLNVGRPSAAGRLAPELATVDPITGLQVAVRPDYFGGDEEARQRARDAYEQGLGNNPDYFVTDDAPGADADDTPEPGDSIPYVAFGDGEPVPPAFAGLISDAKITDDEGNVIAQARGFMTAPSATDGDGSDLASALAAAMSADEREDAPSALEPAVTPTGDTSRQERARKRREDRKRQMTAESE